MATKRYALKTESEFAIEPEYSAPQIARVNRIIDSQLGGALEALGTGIIFDPDNTSLQVTTAGNLSVTVSPGRALVRHSTYGGCFLELDAPVTLDSLEANSTLYLFAALDVTVDNDSRETALPVLLVQDTDAVDGGELLAELVTTSSSVTVNDMRVPFSIAQIEQLESDLGYDATERAKGTVAERLDALATPDGGAAITLQSQLKIAADDDRNSATVMLDLEQRIIALESSSANSGTRPAITDTDQITTELAITRQGVIALQPDEGERSRSANIEATVDGTFGDGTNSHPDFVDYTNATQNDDGEFEV